jgi:hypothetical protein
MKKTLILFCLLAFCITSIAAQTAGAQHLTMMVQRDKKSKDFKSSGLMSDLILSKLSKAKVPTWDFIDSQFYNANKAMLEHPDISAEEKQTIRAGTFEPDVFVEYQLVEKKVEGSEHDKIVELTVSVRESLRDKLLFTKTISSTPRKSWKAGSTSEAWMEAREKVMLVVIEWLKKYSQDLADNGSWCRVTIKKAPAGLIKKVHAKLKKTCAEFEAAKSDLSIYIRSKKDHYEISKVIDQVIEANCPKCDFLKEKMFPKEIVYIRRK